MQPWIRASGSWSSRSLAADVTKTQPLNEPKAAKTHSCLTILGCWGTGSPPSTELLLCCVVCVKQSSVGETGEWWCHHGIIILQFLLQKTVIICTLCWSYWIGTGGSKPTPQTKISVTSVAVIFNQWGLNTQPPRQIERWTERLS